MVVTGAQRDWVEKFQDSAVVQTSFISAPILCLLKSNKKSYNVNCILSLILMTIIFLFASTIVCLVICQYYITLSCSWVILFIMSYILDTKRTVINAHIINISITRIISTIQKLQTYLLLKHLFSTVFAVPNTDWLTDGMVYEQMDRD